jgi:hypothetical protein
MFFGQDRLDIGCAAEGMMPTRTRARSARRNYRPLRRPEHRLTVKPKLERADGWACERSAKLPFDRAFLPGRGHLGTVALARGLPVKRSQACLNIRALDCNERWVRVVVIRLSRHHDEEDNHKGSRRSRVSHLLG